jgi:Ser/Thr protein kinase RdoA (MazF antagonist)
MSCDIAAVLSRFSPFADIRSFVALGNHGGFSGAHLWRGRTADGSAELCLRAWPHGATAGQLALVHGLMSRTRLSFVPRVWAMTQGDTVVSLAGRLWDLTDWMPGAADFHTAPTDARLDAACSALARLHLAWGGRNLPTAPCPAVGRRLVALDGWRRLLASGWRPDFADDPVRPWAEWAWQLLPAALAPLPRQLAAWADRPLPLQPCLCDIWHDHVLFTGDAVTGLIDYGAAKLDHVAVDLARLLGSLLGSDRARRAWALERYAAVCPVGAAAAELTDLLDASGTALGAANWLRWLYHERRPFEDRAAVARRLAVLVGRLETANAIGGRP